jgi:hypothetical protein
MLAVEREYERRAREWALAGKTVTPERLRAMKDVAARRVLELDRETFDATASKRRALRRNAQRKGPMSLREASRLMGVGAIKSTRFVARFIDNGLIPCEQVSPQQWVFDWAKFEDAKRAEQARAKTDKRYKRAR